MRIGITRAAKLVGISAIAVAIAACSNSHALQSTAPTSVPNGDSSGTLATVRFYKAAVAPPSVAAGTTGNFTATVTNCSGATCDATHATTASQAMKSATIAVPPGFTVDDTTFVVSASGGKTWAAALVGTTIQLVKTGSGQLVPGESVTVTFNATAPCASGDFTWTTLGYNNDDFTTTPYERFGSHPSVAVTGTCALGCAEGALGQGHWKTHGDDWPVASLTLGTVNYTKSELLAILNQPAGGNGLVILAYQLIAAKLNVAAGVDGTSIASIISAADTLIGGLVIPPSGAGSVSPATVEALKNALETFNNGCPSGS